MNTDRKIAPIVAQFVPVKLDIASKEYGEWNRDHPSTGTSIPVLYIVRADGETLYGKSGSLMGNELPMMLASALRHSGRILTAKEATALATAAENFSTLKTSGEIEKAVKELGKVRKIGEPGKIPSYSTSAVQLNEMVVEAASEVSTRLEELGVQVQEGDAKAKLIAIMEYLKIRREYGALKMLKPGLTAFQKEFTAKDNAQITREAKIIDSARTANSKSKKTRAAEKLTALIAATELDEVKSLAEATLVSLKSEAEEDDDSN